jgi:hypothetical protein
MTAAMKDAKLLSHKARTTTSFCHHANAFHTNFLHTDACYYLVDQAKHSDVLQLLFKHDPAPVYDLPYIHSQYREQAFDGPLVIKPTTSQSKKWLHNWLTAANALALQGPLLTLEEIRDHLLSLNTVRTPYGDGLFRYSDTATLGSLGASLSHQQRQRTLGPLTAIHGCHAGIHWSLSKDNSLAYAAKTAEQHPLPLELTQQNLASVEVYRRNLLAESLADNHDLAAQTVSDWFQQLIKLGAPNEQGLIEAAGLLIGRGFAGPLGKADLAALSDARPRTCWSDTLDILATFTHSQDGT